MLIINQGYNYARDFPDNPENMVTEVNIQFLDSKGTIFHTQTLDFETGFYDYVLGTAYELSNLYQINIIYGDLLGNNYHITWC